MVLLDTTGNYIQDSVITIMEKMMKKEYTRRTESPCHTAEMNTTL